MTDIEAELDRVAQQRAARPRDWEDREAALDLRRLLRTSPPEIRQHIAREGRRG